MTQFHAWNRYLKLCEVCRAQHGMESRYSSCPDGDPRSSEGVASAVFHCCCRTLPVRPFGAGMRVRSSCGRRTARMGQVGQERGQAGEPAVRHWTKREKEKAPVIADTGLCSCTLSGASCRSEAVCCFGLLQPSREGAAQVFDSLALLYWCPGPESNRHALRRGILSPLRLPISPPGLFDLGRAAVARGELRIMAENGAPGKPPDEPFARYWLR